MDFYYGIISALNLHGLSRLSPFSEDYDQKVENNFIEILFSSDRDTAEVSNGSWWFILLNEGIALNFIDLANAKIPYSLGLPLSGHWSAPWIYYLNGRNFPVLIKLFCDVIKQHFKNRVVIITDYLPVLFSIKISTRFQIKKERKATIVQLANWIIREPNLETKQKIDAIAKDTKKSFKKAIEEIIVLSEMASGVAFVDFSYCLTCGVTVDKGKKFCDGEAKGYQNKDHCLNIFNYWLKARLGIKNTQKRIEKKKEFYDVLQDLMETYPLTAWNRFKDNYPQLYTKRYKERWEREKAKKN